MSRTNLLDLLPDELEALAESLGAPRYRGRQLANWLYAKGVSDLAHSASLQHLAYHVLGQRLEKVLGYAFLLWCVAMLLRDSTGRTKILGVVVLVTIFFIEIYSIVAAHVGGEAPGFLKLFYLPLFIWLLLEGISPRSRTPDTESSLHQ